MNSLPKAAHFSRSSVRIAMPVVLAENPNRTAILEGFTDNRGSEDSNLALSQRRADSVMRYLVGCGVPSERLSSSGRGENAPVADNESVAGRKQNRRVEITLNQASGAIKTGDPADSSAQ